MRALLLVLAISASAWANAPAPWAMCEGKKPGDSCNSLYYPFGKCVLSDYDCREPGKQCLTCKKRGGCDIGADGAGGLAALLGMIILLAIRPRAARP